jgi:hypothetical protein
MTTSTQREAIFLFGPPGSGKTKLASTLQARVYEFDHYPELYFDGNIDPLKIPLAREYLTNCWEEGIARKEERILTTIVRENENTYQLMESALRGGYQVVIKFPPHGHLFYPNDWSEQEQVEVLIFTRSEGSGRFVPSEVIRDCCNQYREKSFYSMLSQ